MNIKRGENETLEQYTKRILELRSLGEISYSEWAKLTADYECGNDNARKSSYYMDAWLTKKLQEETPSSKLDDVKSIIGEFDIKKQEAKSKINQLNKIKRDFIKSIEIANDLKEVMIEDGFCINVPDKYLKEPEVNDFGTMIVHITDWHIGCLIKNCRGNSYNLSIAYDRVDKLINEIYKYASFYGITKIIVVNTGDTIEHTYMRKNQLSMAEFSQSIQVNEATKLIYNFLVRLCEFACVEYYGIAGNHDRSQGDKNINVDGDNANTIINENLATFNYLKPISRLTIHRLPHDAKEIKLEVENTRHKFIHGDERIKDGKRLIENDFSMDDCSYDILWSGHWHNFDMQSENNGRYIIRTGCLSGYNDYSTQFGCATVASQTIGIFVDGKVELIKDVQLA